MIAVTTHRFGRRVPGIVVLIALALSLVLGADGVAAGADDNAGWYGPYEDGCYYWWDGYQWTGDSDCSADYGYAAGWYDGGDGCWYYHDGYDYTGDSDCGAYGAGWYGPYDDGCSYYWDGWGWTEDADCGSVAQTGSVWGDDGCSYSFDGYQWYRDGCLTTDGVSTYWWDDATAVWFVQVTFDGGSTGWMELFAGETVQSGPYIFTGGGSGQSSGTSGNVAVIGGGDIILSPGLVLTGDPATDAILIANHNSTIDTILAPPCTSSYDGCA